MHNIILIRYFELSSLIDLLSKVKYHVIFDQQLRCNIQSDNSRNLARVASGWRQVQLMTRKPQSITPRHSLAE